MLQSYAAIYEHGNLRWLKDAPERENLKVIVTIIGKVTEPERDTPRKYREPPPELAGKMRFLCDEKSLLEPVVPEDEWDALKFGGNKFDASDFQRFLLDSPEMTDEESREIENKRKHLNQWK